MRLAQGAGPSDRALSWTLDLCYSVGFSQLRPVFPSVPCVKLGFLRGGYGFLLSLGLLPGRRDL